MTSYFLCLMLTGDDLAIAAREATTAAQLVSLRERDWPHASQNPSTALAKLVSKETNVDPLIWRFLRDGLVSEAKEGTDPEFILEDADRLIFACDALAASPTGRRSLLQLATSANEYQRVSLCSMALRPLDLADREAILGLLRGDSDTSVRLLALTILIAGRADRDGDVLRLEVGRLANEICESLPENVDVPDKNGWHDLFTVLQLAHCIGITEVQGLEPKLQTRVLPPKHLPPLRTGPILNSRFGRRWLIDALASSSSSFYYDFMGASEWSHRVEALRASAEIIEPPSEFLQEYLSAFKQRELPKVSTPQSELEDVLFLRMIIRNRARLNARQSKIAARIAGRLHVRRSSASPIGYIRAVALHIWNSQPKDVVTLGELPREATLLLDSGAKHFLALFPLLGEAGVWLHVPKKKLAAIVTAVKMDELPTRLRSHWTLACIEAGVDVQPRVNLNALTAPLRRHPVMRQLAIQRPLNGNIKETYNVHRHGFQDGPFYQYWPVWVAVDGMASRELPVGWPIVDDR